MSQKFKVGDKVKIVRDGHSLNGLIAEVVSSMDVDNTYAVETNQGEDGRGVPTNTLMNWTEYSELEFAKNRIRSEWVEEKYLSHIKIYNTKIARKMYPNYKVEGKWLIKS